MLLWGSVLIFTALYISLIFNQNVWTDEIFTMKLLKEESSKGRQRMCIRRFII